MTVPISRMADRAVQGRVPPFLAIARYASKYVRKTKMFWFFLVASWIPAIVWTVVIYTAEEATHAELPVRAAGTSFSTSRSSRLFLRGIPAAGGGLRDAAPPDPGLRPHVRRGFDRGRSDRRGHAAPRVRALLLEADRTDGATSPGSGSTCSRGFSSCCSTRLLFVFLVGFVFLPECFQSCWPVAIQATRSRPVHERGCYALVVLGVSASVRTTRYAVVFWFILAIFTIVAGVDPRRPHPRDPLRGRELPFHDRAPRFVRSLGANLLGAADRRCERPVALRSAPRCSRAWLLLAGFLLLRRFRAGATQTDVEALIQTDRLARWYGPVIGVTDVSLSVPGRSSGSSGRTAPGRARCSS